jgi:hypothetical protein
MEGLLLLVLEPLLALLASILAPLVALVLDLVVGAASLAWQGAALLRLRRGGPAPPRRSPWPMRVAVAGFSLLLVAWLLLEFAFFGAAVRTACERVGRKSGLELSFGSARGWLTTGHLVLKDVKARRGGSDGDSFDLRIEELEIDARPLSLLRGELSLEVIRVRGARGAYDRQGGIDRPPRKPFSADRLEIADARVDWRLHRPERSDFKADLVIERLHVVPFESANAAFCVLFRGDGRGSLAGAPWEITGTGDGAGRRTTWTADRVPVRLLSDFLGEPFDWLAEGTVDVRVTDRWRLGEKPEVDLDWHVVFRDLRAALPDRVQGVKRKFGEAVVVLANRHPKELPLRFTLTLDERGFKGKLSIEALELWDALAAVIVDELAGLAGVTKESIRDASGAAWGKLKGWLEKRARGGK